MFNGIKPFTVRYCKNYEISALYFSILIVKSRFVSFNFQRYSVKDCLCYKNHFPNCIFFFTIYITIFNSYCFDPSGVCSCINLRFGLKYLAVVLGQLMKKVPDLQSTSNTASLTVLFPTTPSVLSAPVLLASL